MEYIVYRRYRGKTVTGAEVNLPACTELHGDELILLNGVPLCVKSSQIAHEHIARNDDGNGLERGKLCYAIAFENRKRIVWDRIQRFTDNEIEVLINRWSHFLIPDIGVVLFNQDFFDANILSLRQMASDLKIIAR